MADQLSGITVIICIAFGVLTFILLFIFAKRQITRFALKSRRGPHVPVGTSASAKLLQEIERRLDAIHKIQYYPCPFNEKHKVLFTDLETSKQITPTHLYRTKAMHDVKGLDFIIAKKYPSKRKCSEEGMQSYYVRLFKAGVFVNLGLSILQNFFILYELARHEPQEFKYEEYCHFVQCLEVIKASLLPVSDDCTSGKENMYDGANREKVHLNESTSLLLDETMSFEREINKRHMPCETPV